MAQPRIHHWKHGWIPLDDVAIAEKLGEGHHGAVARAHLLAASKLAKLTGVEPDITAQLQQEATAAGGRLEGLHNRLKKPDRLAEKLLRKAEQRGSSPEDEARRVTDALRYTMIFPNQTYSQGVNRTVEGFRTHGSKVAVENNWPKGTVYKGVNADVTDPGGNSFELQFHTPESFAQKRAQHHDYEVMRDPKQPVADRKAAYARMLGNWNNVPIPRAINSVVPIVEPKPVTF